MLNWEKPEKCICIKDGYMQSDMAGHRGKQFCYKGNMYNYTYLKGKGHPFDVATEDTKSHSMGVSFFYKYFELYDDKILDDKLFEI